MKEAIIQAQLFKKTNNSIKKAGRVKTVVEISEEDQREMVFRRIKRLIDELKKLEKEYEMIKDNLSKEQHERLKDFFE